MSKFLRIERRNGRQRIVLGIYPYNTALGPHELILPTGIQRPKFRDNDICLGTRDNLIGSIFRVEGVYSRIPYINGGHSGSEEINSLIIAFRSAVSRSLLSDTTISLLDSMNWDMNFDAREIIVDTPGGRTLSLRNVFQWDYGLRAIAQAVPMPRNIRTGEESLKTLDLPETKCPKCGEMRFEALKCKRCGLNALRNPVKWIVSVDSENEVLAPFATYDKWGKSTIRKKVRERLKQLGVVTKSPRGLSRYAGIYVADAGEMLRHIGQAV